MKLHLRIHPGASQEKLIRLKQNNFAVYLTKPARNNQANKALIKLLSKQFALAKSKIKIVQGAKSRTKVVQLEYKTSYKEKKC